MNRPPEAHPADTDESLKYATPTIADYGDVVEVTAGAGGHSVDAANIAKLVSTPG